MVSGSVHWKDLIIISSRPSPEAELRLLLSLYAVRLNVNTINQECNTALSV